MALGNRVDSGAILTSHQVEYINALLDELKSYSGPFEVWLSG